MASLSTALPYGMRDCKVYPFTDALGTTLAATGYDLPYMQTFSFTDTEEFTELRGDDDLVATHGQGAQVKWSLEAGGIDLTLWSIFTGGQIVETGTTPNRVVTLRKCSDDARPYFYIAGQIISDTGGDIIARVYRCKANGDISGQFSDAQFFVTNCDGIGLPVPGSRLLYDIVQNETISVIGTTGETVPIMPPKGVAVYNIAATTASAQWLAVGGATGYVVEKAVSPYSTWTSAGADPTTNSIAITGLTTATAYKIRVKTKTAAGTGAAGALVPFTTL